MLYIYDVWANWFEGEENGYNVCYFHEWRKEDSVELLDKVPLIKVIPALFYYIENGLSPIPKSLLDSVYQKATFQKNNERTQMEYCFIVTDGIEVLIVDTIGYNIPIRKSRLIPRQEQLVCEMVENVSAASYIVAENFKRDYHILSPAPELMNGLTRKERQLKNIYFMALDQLLSTKNVAQVRYWYTEWNPEQYEIIQQTPFEDVWKRLYEETKSGWTKRHIQLCESLIKGQPFFEQLWEIEQESKVN